MIGFASTSFLKSSSFEQGLLQALNQEKAQTQFSSCDEVSMWDMIDMSALPANQLGSCSPSSEFGTHLDIPNRFWEHHPSSSVHYWDDFSRVRSATDTCISCLPSLIVTVLSKSEFDVGCAAFIQFVTGPKHTTNCLGRCCLYFASCESDCLHLYQWAGVFNLDTV